jgi:hypothetical protein
MDKMYNLVGVSTYGKITKFRVANGDVDARVKVLERAGCTDINFIQLDTPMSKLDAIATYKAKFPDSEGIRMPNEGKAKTPKAAKTVNVKGTGRTKTTDAALELLNAVEETA